MRRAFPAVAAVLAACAWGLKPGPTAEGVAYSVEGAPADAARAAAASALDLFVAPDDARRPRAEAVAREKASSVAGKSRLRGGRGAVEVRLDRLARVLDEEKLLKPEGFAGGPPRVVVLVNEPDRVLNLGIGPAGDALRRGLAARGVSAADGGDPLDGRRYKGRTPQELVAAWRGGGADWVIAARAAVEHSYDREAGAWRARASLAADAWDAEKGVAVESFSVEASALDLSSAAARGKALEQAGEEAAGRAHAALAAAGGGRSAAAVLVYGSRGGLPELLSALRRLEGVRGAHLASWKGGPDGSSIVRAYLEGLKVDELAARLMRGLPAAAILSVETEDARLSVELPGGRDA